VTNRLFAEQTALIQDVVRNPTDNVPRLVYADWCEDNGHETYARLCRYPHRLGMSRTKEQEKSVLTIIGGWGGVVGNHGFDWSMAGAIDGMVDNLPGWIDGIVIRRGFIEEVYAPLKLLLENCVTLVNKHPITRCVAVDRIASIREEEEPERGRYWVVSKKHSVKNPGWHNFDDHWLPNELHHPDAWKGYKLDSIRVRFTNDQNPMDALSAAILWYAREGYKSRPLGHIDQ